MQRQICLDYVKTTRDLEVLVSVFQNKSCYYGYYQIWVMINIGQSWPNCVTAQQPISAQGDTDL